MIVLSKKMEDTLMSDVFSPMLIGLANGVVFDASQPETFEWDPMVIARGLSNTCRFAGQLCGDTTIAPFFYSVAEHSILVHDLLVAWGADPPLLVAGLLHDAHEAVYGDIPTPLKPIVGPVFRRMVDRFDVRIADLAQIDVALFRHRDLKHADRVALHIEAAAFTATPWPRPYHPPPALEGWRHNAGKPPAQAEREWFQCLGSALSDNGWTGVAHG